ncbi:MAG: urate hydroxylase PuuD [Pseudomonadota bacterium]
MDYLFSQAGAEQLLRWLHFFFGVVWIGTLYYFNFIQGEFFKEAEAATKSNMIQKQLPRALDWFRYGALWTFVSGALILAIRGANITDTLFVGVLLGTLMFLNVWLIIWPNQKIVIASTSQVAQGGAALPEAAAAGPKALLASRTNVMFSLAMLFFMGAGAHLPFGMFDLTAIDLWIAVALIAALEVNALKGKLGPLTTVKGVIHCGVALTLVLLAVLAFI